MTGAAIRVGLGGETGGGLLGGLAGGLGVELDCRVCGLHATSRTKNNTDTSKLGLNTQDTSSGQDQPPFQLTEHLPNALFEIRPERWDERQAVS